MRQLERISRFCLGISQALKGAAAYSSQDHGVRAVCRVKLAARYLLDREPAVPCKKAQTAYRQKLWAGTR